MRSSGRTAPARRPSSGLVSGDAVTRQRHRAASPASDVTDWTFALAGFRASALARSFQVTSIVIAGFTTLENVALAVQARQWVVVPVASVAVRTEVRALNATGLRGSSRSGRSGPPGQRNFKPGTLAHGEKRQLELAVVLARASRNCCCWTSRSPVPDAEETDRLVGLLRSLRGQFGILLGRARHAGRVRAGGPHLGPHLTVASSSPDRRMRYAITQRCGSSLSGARTLWHEKRPARRRWIEGVGPEGVGA